jgi:hypothetical protein
MKAEGFNGAVARYPTLYCMSCRLELTNIYGAVARYPTLYCMSCRLELTYNYGVDSYPLGDGFGHFGLAVNDVKKTAETIQAAGMVTGSYCNKKRGVLRTGGRAWHSNLTVSNVKKMAETIPSCSYGHRQSSKYHGA